jgi:hypothetical protein
MLYAGSVAVSGRENKMVCKPLRLLLATSVMSNGPPRDVSWYGWL